MRLDVSSCGHSGECKERSGRSQTVKDWNPAHCLVVEDSLGGGRSMQLDGLEDCLGVAKMGLFQSSTPCPAATGFGQLAWLRSRVKTARQISRLLLVFSGSRTTRMGNSLVQGSEMYVYDVFLDNVAS